MLHTRLDVPSPPEIDIRPKNPNEYEYEFFITNFPTVDCGESPQSPVPSPQSPVHSPQSTVQYHFKELRLASKLLSWVLNGSNHMTTHVGKVVKEKPAELGCELLPSPPYAPDLAPSDYHLIRSLLNHDLMG